MEELDILKKINNDIMVKFNVLSYDLTNLFCKNSLNELILINKIDKLEKYISVDLNIVNKKRLKYLYYIVNNELYKFNMDMNSIEISLEYISKNIKKKNSRLKRVGLIQTSNLELVDL